MTDNENIQQGEALLIVDVQNGFVCPDTSHIPALVEKLQYDYETVIATQFYNQEGSFFRTLINWEHLQADTDEFDLAFKLREDGLRVVKPIYTCVDRRLLDYLTRRAVKRVDICGIDTDICVTKCAVDLFENGIVPVVLKSFCGSTAGEGAHKHALQTLGRFIGRDQVR
ncbi:cysteine hydrolase [Pseudophaeobacter arcticus]|uniref:Cysteine hydrolase n=1 Tax=Pseudophaeobacter arcticus TaxID=385492 RepID=A0ABQ0AS96_9RHOB